MAIKLTYQIWDMLCDRPGAIADGAKVYDTCNHLELFKEDLARK
jgi:hypothetical protein